MIRYGNHQYCCGKPLLMSYFKPGIYGVPITYLIGILSSQIVNNPLVLPDDMTPQLKNLLEGLLCKGW